MSVCMIGLPNSARRNSLLEAICSFMNGRLCRVRKMVRFVLGAEIDCK